MLALQLNDSAIDQLRLRIPRLPEVVAAAAAAAEVTDWEKRTAELRKQAAGFEAAINASEHENERINKHRVRLEQQLKTVIAPREAEALMHEIATLNGQRSVLDDAELEAMDGLGEAESKLAALTENEPRLRAAVAATAESAALAVAAAEAEMAERAQESARMRADLDPAMLKRYDAMRPTLNGIAIAKLNGLRCDGCHLDLSRGEVDDLKRLPGDEFGECPNCGRLLVR